MKKGYRAGLIILFLIGSISTWQIQNVNAANAYFISQIGNDNNPGTKTKPFKTLQKINTIKLNPGDQIYLKGKESFPGTLLLNVNGSSHKPILITSYGGGKATIGGGTKEAIILHGSHFQLKNINVKGAGR